MRSCHTQKQKRGTDCERDRSERDLSRELTPHDSIRARLYFPNRGQGVLCETLHGLLDVVVGNGANVHPREHMIRAGCVSQLGGLAY